MFKFLHAADLHLDSPLRNLDRYDGAPVEAFRTATRRAFDNLIELAVAEQVQFVLIAGDLYDGDCRDFNTPLHFRRRMEELGAHGIRTFIVQGNHDAENNMRKAFRLRLPDNVHLFRTDRPETVTIDDLNVAIHGQGFAQRAVEKDISQQYPPPVSGWLNVGLLHTSCGHYEAHERYAPSTIPGLTNKGYQYWALGHIHKYLRLAGPEGGRVGAGPWIVYPGNTQGRHIREEGSKGCVLATVDDDRIDVSRRTLDVLRWQTCEVDAGECDDAETVLAETQARIDALLEKAGDRPLAVRVEIAGASGAHRELTRYPDYWDRRIREATVDRFTDRVWIEKIRIGTRPLRDASPREVPDELLGELVAGIRDASPRFDAVEEIRDDFEQLRKLLPTDPRIDDEPFDLDDERTVASLLDDVNEFLIGRLTDSGDGE